MVSVADSGLTSRIRFFFADPDFSPSRIPPDVADPDPTGSGSATLKMALSTIVGEYKKLIISWYRSGVIVQYRTSS
jgi:hypothetical protein